MSTIRTVNIQHPSSSTPSITMDSTGAMTGSFPYPNRNLIYNGAMQIHQRGTSASITGGDYFTADRWQTSIVSLGTWTQSVENDAPTGSGFRKSLKMLCTTADASPAAGDYCLLIQHLEGQDLQRVAKGTTSAQPLTLSFWVKSNVTGTYTASLYDNDNTRLVSAAYTISASATWEKKTITFPADTTGAFDNDNASSLQLYLNLGAGSNRSSGTLQTTWGAYVAANWMVGQTNLAAATNNYWQVTGVQLEASPVATPFEFIPFGVELHKCKRYYQKSFSYNQIPIDNTTSNTIILGNYAFIAGGGTTAGTNYNPGRVVFEVEFRDEPSTIVLYQPNGTAGNAGNTGRFGDVANGSVSTSFVAAIGNKTSKFMNINPNNGNGMFQPNPYGINWTASAEL